eukprot:RCo011836
MSKRGGAEGFEKPCNFPSIRYSKPGRSEHYWHGTLQYSCGSLLSACLCVLYVYCVCIVCVCVALGLLPLTAVADVADEERHGVRCAHPLQPGRQPGDPGVHQCGGPAGRDPGVPAGLHQPLQHSVQREVRRAGLRGGTQEGLVWSYEVVLQAAQRSGKPGDGLLSGTEHCPGWAAGEVRPDPGPGVVGEQAARHRPLQHRGDRLSDLSVGGSGIPLLVDPVEVQHKEVEGIAQVGIHVHHPRAGVEGLARYEAVHHPENLTAIGYVHPSPPHHGDSLRGGQLLLNFHWGKHLQAVGDPLVVKRGHHLNTEGRAGQRKHHGADLLLRGACGHPHRH